MALPARLVWLTEKGEAQDEVSRAGGSGGRSEAPRAHRRRSGGHFEKRTEAMDGKAMVVCMSRRICVDLFNALIKLRPESEAETLKIVMAGSAEDGKGILRCAPRHRAVSLTKFLWIKTSLDATMCLGFYPRQP